MLSNPAIAIQRQTTQTWVVEKIYLTVQFTPATRCMTATGNNNLTITVWKQEENVLDTGATVSATVTKPDESTDSINFSNQGDGNYTNTYNFDANGTWKFDVTATHSDYTEGTTESYVYVGDFNLLISFVNNGQNVYDRYTGSVRNLVTNEDGNYFTGITGNTTIYYPNSSVWVSSQSMTESGSGEYYYNFTAPTTLGEYSATSSFTCGANTDSNSQGRFTVVTSCGNGTCDTGWESCSTCSADCGACPSTPVAPGGGGGISGGVAAPPSEPTILSWSFDETPKIGSPLAITVKISNPGQERNFLLSTKISQVKETLYSETEHILNAKANETREIALPEKFTPKLAGSNTIEIRLFSETGQVYDELIETFDIEGEVRYDLAIECLDKLERVGGEASASITLLNLGDYYKDVQLSWWVEDSEGRQLGLALLPIALYSNESRSLLRSALIPEGSPTGNYSFKAVVDYKGQKTEALCSFIVEESEEYYTKIVEGQEKQLEELVESVQEKKEQGHDVLEIEEKIREVRTLIFTMQGGISEGDFTGLDGKIAEADAIIEEIADAERQLKALVFFALPFGLPEFLIFAALILLIAIALILYKSKKLMDRLLGLEEKPKKRKKGRKRRKKWRKKRKERHLKPFEKLLGLQEQKARKLKKKKGKKARRRRKKKSRRR